MNPWIPWKGGECSVPKGTLVDIKLQGRQSNQEIHRIKVKSDKYHWEYIGQPKYGHIIAYRIHEERK